MLVFNYLRYILNSKRSDNKYQGKYVKYTTYVTKKS